MWAWHVPPGTRTVHRAVAVHVAVAGRQAGIAIASAALRPMSTVAPDTGRDTHAVTNQATPLEDYNVYLHDRCLRDSLRREGGALHEDAVVQAGESAGSAHMLARGRLANVNKPKFVPFDRFGHRIDAVEYHDGYHDCMSAAFKHGIHSFAWNRNREEEEGSHVARAAMIQCWNQMEAGHCCPITMTFACVPVLESLRSRPVPSGSYELSTWIEKLTSSTYDSSRAPITEKVGATLGMSMTEKQGGSDVRANTTIAKPLVSGQTGHGAQYALTGHKWFTSAPMCDGFLTLAYDDDHDHDANASGDSQGNRKGLSCFLVPRFLPDGSQNRGFNVQRLKDKLGDHSNASSEVEYHNAWGQMVGDPGRGVPTIIEMVSHTRLDCALGSSGHMRHAVAQAIHHTSQRQAFGGYLQDMPLMQNVLADLAVESEAATTMVMRIARSFEDARTYPDDEYAQAFNRIATAVAKYWICKRTPNLVYESMECWGGNGYVEEGPMPTIFRQSPLNAIWEGSGNVIALDIFRSFIKEPATADAFLKELELAKGIDSRFDTFVSLLRDQIYRCAKDPLGYQMAGRAIADAMAVGLQGSLLLQHGDPDVVTTFCMSRFGTFDETGLVGGGFRNYGTLVEPEPGTFANIVKRAGNME